MDTTADVSANSTLLLVAGKTLRRDRKRISPNPLTGLFGELAAAASLRQHLLVALKALAVSLGLVCLGAWVAPAAARPNILIILTDDQRDVLDNMPKTAQLFREGGVMFRNAFSATPLCCPSRASLMTGQYSHNHGVRTNTAGGRLQHRSTVQFYLQRSGYRTGVVGKFLSGRVPDIPPYFNKWAVSRQMEYFGSTFNVNGRTRKIGRYSTDYVASKSAGFIRSFEKHDRKPWFLLIAPKAPHSPFTPGSEYVGAEVQPWNPPPSVGEKNRRDKPKWVRAQNHHTQAGRRHRIRQLRTLMSVDDLVQKLHRRMKRLGENRRTLAFFTSDNGFQWAEHGLLFKEHPYLESVGIPLLVRWPTHLERGMVKKRMVANIDIAPTIMKAANVTASPSYPMDGRPLFGSSKRKRLLLEYWYSGGIVPTWASLLTTNAQFTRYYRNNGRPRFGEYYDLVTDPWQLVNLLNDGHPNNPDTSGLRRRLARARDCKGASCP